MKSQINKVFYFKEYKLMSRVISFLYLKRSKDDNVFNINMKRSILVYNGDTSKTCIVFARRFVKRSFLNEGSYFRKCDCLTKDYFSNKKSFFRKCD